MERVPLEAPDGEPLVLELSQFLGAIAGRNPVAVTGEEGREALEAALRIVTAIEAAGISVGAELVGESMPVAVRQGG